MADSPFDAIRAKLPAPVGQQPGVLALPPNGHHVVLGTAGSGKTTMAMYRALQLADPRTLHHGRTLLVTFNRSLLAYVNHVIDDANLDLDVRNYHRFARGYLAHRAPLGYGVILDDVPRRSLITQALREIRAADRDRGDAVLARELAFFIRELDWIANHNIETQETYLGVDRVGRGAALGRTGRQTVWRVREAYLRLRAEQGKRYDWKDIAAATLDALAKDDSPRLYRHIVVDEGQDFSPAMVRSLVAAVGAGGSLTFFGDVAQQIYGRGVSWRSAGLNLPSAGVIRFTRNHRNSPQIAAVAEAIAAMPYYDPDDEDLVRPNQFADAGPTPALVRFADPTAERVWVVQQATRLGRLASVGILFRRNSDVDAFLAACPSAERLDRETPTWAPEPGIWAMTAHGAKGFEFQSVILSRLDAALWPEAQAIAGDGEEEARAGDGRLLYVSVTRARQNLLMTFTGDTVTDLLPANDELWVEQQG